MEVVNGDVEPRANQAAVSTHDVWLASGPGGSWGGTRLWFSELRKRLAELSVLPKNWDSYGGEPLQPISVSALVSTLIRFDDTIRSRPRISLSHDGGLVCEWASGEFSVDLISSSDGAVTVYFADEVTGEEWEGPLQEAGNVDKWLWQASGPA